MDNIENKKDANPIDERPPASNKKPADNDLDIIDQLNLFDEYSCSSIALDELFSLRRAIRSVTRELTSLRKSNKEMQEMIKQLHIDHGDALGRIEGTNLMAQERELWESKFAREFRKYEEAMKHNPHILTPNAY